MTSAADAATKARQELSLVNLELAHRLKNLLAVVAAIASSSLRTVTPRIDVATFNSRIRALAAAQDMLIGEARGVADLSALASSVAGNLCDSNQIEISGPPLAVGPSAALSLSLILHELVTNALKYGALSTSNGRASFVWSITEDDPPKIEARWEERGGPIVEAPHQKGFGTRLISMGLIGQGDAQVFFRPEGLQVALSAPLCAVTEQSPHAIGKA
jgi:two-component sensor histidine kinase